MTGAWSPTWCPLTPARSRSARRRTATRTPGSCVPGSRAGCRTTWSRPRSWRWTAIPLTTGGKVDRAALPVPAAPAGRGASAPLSGDAAALAGIWAGVLGVSEVGADDSFFELGGDSILAIQVVSRARAAGLAVTSKDIFVYQTIGELSAAGRLTPAQAPPGAAPDVPGPAPLGPIQRWFTQAADGGEAGDISRFTMSVLVDLDDAVDGEILGRALAAVIDRHEALRMRFTRSADGQWAQEPATAPAEAVLTSRDLSHIPAEGRAAAVHDLAVAAQASLDITAGPVLRAVRITGGGAPAQLFLTIHHLVTDGVSWRILLADLDAAYQRLADQSAHPAQPARLPEPAPPGTGYRQWARLLAEHVRSGALDADLAYWATQPATADPSLPAGLPGANTVGAAAMVTARLGRAETGALLRQVPAAYRTQVTDILLAALGTALARWAGRDRVLIAVEGHGREDILDGTDLTQTVGWFTTEYPLALHVPGAAWPAAGPARTGTPC